ncbi:hypothetical protein [Aldersonia sp. NBC_00410]|uniref:hypothetical protein n=1 Tax=Aldersonia sp. NBC_00410 TaxID=2975954 RepID=UPI002259CF2B|nr:hypothetical protein [Aldersonia sp. NBC_00410]
MDIEMSQVDPPLGASGDKRGHAIDHSVATDEDCLSILIRNVLKVSEESGNTVVSDVK